MWRRVQTSVRPIEKRIKVQASTADLVATRLSPDKRARGRVPVAGVVSAPMPIARPVSAPRTRVPTNTLDGGWDKRLSRGSISPDRVIDLHGHSLASAHAALDHGIAAALSSGDRVILLVTGKPPRPESERPHARGAIREGVGDWLAGSRHADRIAAIRPAHPRHGGKGALYVILRRSR